MTPKQLERIGKRLFGANWKSALGRAIGRGYVAIHRMAEGDTSIGPTTETAIAGVEAMRGGFVPSWATDGGDNASVIRRAMTEASRTGRPEKPKPKARAVAVRVQP